MIKNVIFDLSEVLLPGMIGVEVGLERTTGVARDSITRAMGSHPHYQVGNVLDELLKGILTYEQYRDVVLRELDGVSTKVFDKHCLGMFAEPYEYTERMLAVVSKSCDIFLLSDHCEVWASYICNRHEFMGSFKDIVWSYEIGATKREPMPFEHLLSENDLVPECTLFVDDLDRNIETARKFKMKTIHFKGKASVQDVFDAIGLANTTSETMS